ncbi:MAG TPA: flagellar basal body rod protein FlgC [Solirubrobacteraceae bacterium]|jgi:flagellar basal-body rod protein FlgC|nr:flagellar basal body rod protein FlgC [Solirubrobacteraceae bacterium]
MGLFDSMGISASGLSAERTRMDVTAENLANAQTTRTAAGGPYRRKEVVLAQEPGSFGSTLAAQVKVQAIVQDGSAPRMEYDPSNPDADAQGYVAMPNVDTVAEMVDLITEQRSYEANTTAMDTAKAMFGKTLDILR